MNVAGRGPMPSRTPAVQLLFTEGASGVHAPDTGAEQSPVVDRRGGSGVVDVRAAPPAAGSTPPSPVAAERGTADRVFLAVTLGAGLATLALLGLIAVFLVTQSLPALRAAGSSFLTTFEWDVDGRAFGIAAVLFGTVITAGIAFVLAVPVAVGTALFINDYAPPRLRGILVSLVDLLAAVPSLIYGLWGLYFLQPRLNGTTRWLADHLGFLPIFASNRTPIGASPFVAGVVLAIMIVPIVTSVSREVLRQTPVGLREAALALGGTRWGMIRQVVLPFGRSGVVGASMLGLGRALGETIAVALILGFTFDIGLHVLEPGGSSIAGLIAVKFGEAGELERSALVAAGLVLFVLTLLVNMGARVVVGRTRPLRGMAL
ncbi:MAG: phosphate ABC transporter permease subunit PstC [Acidimicrobiales bacterium]